MATETVQRSILAVVAAFWSNAYLFSRPCAHARQSSHLLLNSPNIVFSRQEIIAKMHYVRFQVGTVGTVFKSKRLASENPDLWTSYKTESFLLCYAADFGKKPWDRHWFREYLVNNALKKQRILF